MPGWIHSKIKKASLPVKKLLGEMQYFMELRGIEPLAC
jgi:hypothetical protein